MERTPEPFRIFDRRSLSITAIKEGVYPQRVEDLGDLELDWVVTVCGHADEHCPNFPGKTRVVHVAFDDPPKLAAEAKSEEEALVHYRRVRDEIREFIFGLPGSLHGPQGD